MSSIALGMQVNELEARIVALENKAGGSAMMGDMMKDILILHGMARKQEERLAELESMVAMMLPQAPEPGWQPEPLRLGSVKPAKAKATRA